VQGFTGRVQTITVFALAIDCSAIQLQVNFRRPEALRIAEECVIFYARLLRVIEALFTDLRRAMFIGLLRC